MGYPFFFCYAQEDRRNSLGLAQEDGEQLNYVDEFFDQLCALVAQRLGISKKEAGFLDIERNSSGDLWSKKLCNNLSTNACLVCLVTPGFLRDVNGYCGKEVQVFLKRHELLEGDVETLRILPIYWENVDQCWLKANESTKELFQKLHYSLPGLHDQYPSTGLHRIRRCSSKRSYDEYLFAIVDRIVQMIQEMEPLPPIEEDLNFEDIESAFQPDPSEVCTVAKDSVSMDDIAPAVEVGPPSSLPGLPGVGGR